jgi:hypothetical protein
MTTTLSPRSTKRCQHLDQARYVIAMQPGGGLVQHVERGAVARRCLAELGHQLEALRLAAAEGVAGLPEAQVAEPQVRQQLERAAHLGHALEHADRRPTSRSSSAPASSCRASARASVLSSKRAPRQVSQGTMTSGRNDISATEDPLPSQVSQRPPAVLNEKRVGS